MPPRPRSRSSFRLWHRAASAAALVGRWLHNSRGGIIGSVKSVSLDGRKATIVRGIYTFDNVRVVEVLASTLSLMDGKATLRGETAEALNVVETWNSANSFIFFGKGGEVASNRLDDREVSVHALHLLRSRLVYVNTLMLQQVLAEFGRMAWQAALGCDWRALVEAEINRSSA